MTFGTIINNTLHLAEIGDTGLVIIRDGFITRVSTGQVSEDGVPSQISCARGLQGKVNYSEEETVKGDIIFTFSDGLYSPRQKTIEDVAERTIQLLKEGKNLEQICETLIWEARKSRTWGDDAIMMAARI
jgi:serine/threonine protein phosphatase PrpC